MSSYVKILSPAKPGGREIGRWSRRRNVVLLSQQL
jgi:hypothetical protein